EEAGGADFGFGPASANTDNMVVSNSYFENIVGSVGKGGSWNFNFIKNPVIDDGGGACSAGFRRSGLVNPVNVYGNVMTRTHASSCLQFGVYFAGYSTGSDWTTSTRKVVSNLITNIGWDRTDEECSSIATGNEGVNFTGNIDVYNNVMDFRGNTCGRNNNVH